MIVLANNVFLDQIANGQIISHEQHADDGAVTYSFEWQGGPFARIDRRVWGDGRFVGVQRNVNTARIGPFDLLLIEDEPNFSWEVWYSAPPTGLYLAGPAVPAGGGACHG